MTRWILVPGLVVTFTLALFLLLRSGEVQSPGSSPEDVERGDPTSTVAAAEDPLPPAAALPLEKEEEPPVSSAEPPEEAPESPAPEQPEPTPEAHVVGRAVDEDGRAIGGAVFARVFPQGPEAISGPDGRFEWSVADQRYAQSSSFRLSAPGRATRGVKANLVPRRTSHLGDLVLEAGGELIGRVVDPDGRPLSDIRVIGTSAAALSGDQTSARLQGPSYVEREGFADALTGERGEFRLQGAPLGWVRAWAHRDGARWSVSEPVQIEAGRTADAGTLVLEPLAPEERIEGIVLSPAEEPVPFAQVEYQYRTGFGSGIGSIQAGEDGRFRIQTSKDLGHELTAVDKDGRWSSARPVTARPGDLDVELRLGEPRTIVVLVRDAGGEPIESFEVSCTNHEGFDVRGVERVKASAPGRAEIAVPPEPFGVQVEAEGFVLGQQGPFAPESAPKQLEFDLQRLPAIRGIVFGEGKPLAGARVGLYEAIGETSKMTVNGFAARSKSGATVEATSGDDGTFELSLRGRGRYYLRAEKSGWAPGEIGPVPLDGEAGASGLTIPVSRGGTLRVEVVAPSGDPTGTVVGISRGDGKAMTLRVGPEGVVAFERLTPGPWHVMRREEMLDPNSTSTSTTTGQDPADWRIPSNCQVYEERVTTFVLDLSEQGAAVVSGQLLFDGQAPVVWSARLARRGGPHEPSDPTPLDGEGRFRLQAPEPGDYRLVLTGRAGDFGLTLTEDLELSAGRVDWAKDFETGSVQGQITGEGQVTLSATVGGLQVLAHARPPQDGGFTCPELPAASYTAWLSRPDGTDQQSSLQIESGERAQLQLQ